MSPRDWQVRVEDILGAIAAIQSYTRGMTFDAFAKDQRTVDAVVHNFMIIGEAAGSLPEAVVSAHPELPWDKMRAMRNIIAHAYFGIRKDIVWQTSREDLPPLVPKLKSILERGQGKF